MTTGGGIHFIIAIITHLIIIIRYFHIITITTIIMEADSQEVIQAVDIIQAVEASILTLAAADYK